MKIQINKRNHPYPLLLILLILSSLLGSAAKSPATSISHSNIVDMQLIKPETGWVIVADELFWTEDNGMQWNNISPGNGSVRAAYFINESSGFAITRTEKVNGVVDYSLHSTTDQGQTWQSKGIASYPSNKPLAASQTIHLFFLNDQTGWVVFKQQSSSNFNVGALFGTKDAGNTWEELSIPIGEKVLFLTAEIGYTVGGLNEDHIYRTEDGGLTWELEDPSPTDNAKLAMPSFSSAGIGLSIIFEDSTSIQIAETNNGGRSWTNAATANIENTGLDSFPTISFTDQTMIFTPSERITYEPISSAFNSSPIAIQGILTQLDGTSPDFLWGVTTDSYCPDPDNFNSCKQFQELVYSVDEGITWRVISTPVVQENLTIINEFESQPQAVPVIDYPRTNYLTGQGFDICEIPSEQALSKWKFNGPYAAVNLYIGGVSRACANVNLNTDGDLFLQALSIQGWKFIPTWVGHQAYCTNFTYKMSSNVSSAYLQGRGNADDAARIAMKLGLAAEDQSGTVIYYDLEGFDSTDTGCLNAARAFINGWVSRLHEHGIMAGVYGSSCASGLSNFATISNPPDVLWPAAWYPLGTTYTSDASTFGLPCLSNTLWDDHERIRQYAGGHYEYWGGTALQIDSNVIDGVVADISNFVGVPSPKLQNTSFETSSLAPWKINLNENACNWSIPNTLNARTGEYVLSISKTAAQTNCTGVSQSISLIPSAGETYRFAVWARSTSPSSPRSVSLKISATGGTTESTMRNFYNIDDTWRCLEVAHTIKNNNQNQVRTEVLLRNTDGVDVMIDDAQISLNTASLCPTIPLPTNFEASKLLSFDRVVLSWDTVPNASVYNIYRSKSVDGVKTLVGKSTTNDYIDSDGNPSDGYVYWVRGCVAGKCSPYSNYDTGSFSPVRLDFSDDFETGDFVRWPSVVNGTKIYTCDNNPITGSVSACASVTSSTSAFISQQLIVDTNKLIVAFDLDPNDAVLGNRTYTILLAPSNSGIAFQLNLKYESPNYVAWLDWSSGGTLQSSRKIAIPNRPAHYQISWNSSGVDARSLSMFQQISLSVNNVEKILVPRIDNSGIFANGIYFGLLPNSTITTGTDGYIIFDNFSFTGPQYLR